MEAQIKEILKENRLRISVGGYGRAINSLLAVSARQRDDLAKNKELADDELTDVMMKLKKVVDSLDGMKLSHPNDMAVLKVAVVDIIKMQLQLTAVRDDL